MNSGLRGFILDVIFATVEPFLISELLDISLLISLLFLLENTHV
jgi:hypothetical protein